MSGESPDVVLYDGYSNALAVQDGVAIPASTPALIAAGSDGTNSHYLAMTASAPLASTFSLVVAQSPNLPLTNTVSSVTVNASTNGNNTLIAGVAGKTIRVFKVALTFSVGGTVIFQDGSSTQLTGPLTMFAGGSIVLDMDITNPWFLTSTANAFVVNLVSGAAMGGVIYYTQS